MVSVSTRPGFGYEADVHYSLTYWLARKAGFSIRNAYLIATADLSKDLGSYSPATWGVAHILLTGDRAASDAIRKDHFPSEASLPAPPNERQVVPNSSAGRVEIERILALNSDIRDERWLSDIGSALHSLQDSWSHRGIPDIPFGPFFPTFRPSLSWGHPCDRGGWSSHDADLTFRDFGETNEMAREFCRILVPILEARPTLREHPSADWKQIAADVRSFGRASTKAAKATWFMSFADVPFSEYPQA